MDRKRGRHLRAACAGLALIAACSSLSACSGFLDRRTQYEADDGDRSRSVEPAKLEPIEGTEVKRVIFSKVGAEQVGLETATVRNDGDRKVIPHAAVLYDAEGRAFTYTSPEGLTFVREAIEVDRVEGDSVVLSDGPPAGTGVVTVGAAQVYGTEFEVSH